MIIHVIAAEIRECRRCQFDAIETVLIEPVRRRLECEMRHAFIGEAESQVERVLNHVQELANQYPEAVNYTPGEIV